MAKQEISAGALERLNTALASIQETYSATEGFAKETYSVTSANQTSAGNTIPGEQLVGMIDGISRRYPFLELIKAKGVYRTMANAQESMLVRNTRTLFKKSLPVGCATGNCDLSDLNYIKFPMPIQKMSNGFCIENAVIEDSGIDIRGEVTNEIKDSLDLSLEDSALNGDKLGAVGNVNALTAAPTGTENYLQFRGVRAYGLNTVGANTNALNNLALSMFAGAQAKLGIYGSRISDLAYIMDTVAYNKLYSLVTTIANVSQMQFISITNSVITHVNGIQVVVSDALCPTTPNGKIDNVTAANNTQGTICLVHIPHMIMGIRRQLEIKSAEFVCGDSCTLVAHPRVAFEIFTQTLGAQCGINNRPVHVIYNV